jgi:hypothetical protein
MDERRRRRWRRYAAASALQAVLFAAALLVPLPNLVAVALFVVVGLLLFLAAGPVQAHVALNADLDDRERVHWRIAVAVVPGAVAYYWHLFVR